MAQYEAPTSSSCQTSSSRTTSRVGLVALEAAVRRTPVVASDLQGIPDAVHDGRNGWLVPAEDAAAFAAKIADVLAMAPCERRAQGECFRAYTAANLSWDRAASAYWQCFVETVKHFRAARARG